jgi:hypothetical protein
MSKIPFYFSGIPDQLMPYKKSDPISFCIIGHIFGTSKPIDYEYIFSNNRRKLILLVPGFHFIYGRKKFSEELNISQKMVRDRMEKFDWLEEIKGPAVGPAVHRCKPLNINGKNELKKLVGPAVGPAVRASSSTSTYSLYRIKIERFTNKSNELKKLVGPAVRASSSRSRPQGFGFSSHYREDILEGDRLSDKKEECRPNAACYEEAHIPQVKTDVTDWNAYKYKV